MLYEDYVKQMTGCPFCDGNNRVLADSEHAFLTYAIAPYHRHHLLVIPRRHVESIDELTEDELTAIDRLQELGLSLLKKLHYKSISFLVREGQLNINKSVMHSHFHLIPEILIGNVDHNGEPRRVLTDDEISTLMNELLPLVSAA